MSIVEDAPTEEVSRLLQLFPVASLKAVWGAVAPTKEEICAAVAAQLDSRAQVVTFVNDHFSCCKQHITVFDRPAGAVAAFPATFGAWDERVHLVAGQRALYIGRVAFQVILSEPFESAEVSFLWPFRLELSADHLIVRMVALEKNLSAYFDRAYYGAKRTVKDEDLLSDILQLYPFALTDIHQGVKAAWAEDFMDATRVRYKKPNSTASEEMDEERGIKAFNHALYNVLANASLFKTFFKIDPAKNLSVSVVAVEPLQGYLAFPRYSEHVGDTDVVIQKILTLNH